MLMAVVSILGSNCGGIELQKPTKGECLGTRADVTHPVLAEEIPALLGNLSFPKTMRWNSQASYSRPLRWFLALHGDTIVPFTYASVLSGRSSRVLRNSLQPTIQVAKAEDHLEAIKEAGLVISMTERKETIWAQSSELAASISGQIPDESKGGLLEELANLVECPTPLPGSFDETFLQLPSDVLITVCENTNVTFRLLIG